MNDEIRHRYEKNGGGGRYAAMMAVATVIFSALWEYCDPAETTKYAFAGLAAGVPVGFLLCYFTSQKR